MSKTGVGENLPKRIGLAAALLFALALLILGFYPPLFQRVVLSPPLWIVREVLSFFHSGVQSTREGWHQYVRLLHAEQENVALRREVALLSVRLEQAQTLFVENAKLKALLGLKNRISIPGHPCRVLADNPTVGHRTLIIGCGAKEGVRLKDGVMGPTGVVGFVVKVFPDFSQVLWLEDTFFAMEGLLSRTGQKGVVEGMGIGKPLRLNYIPVITPVQKGDAVVTSGEDGFFPPNEPIGFVDGIQPIADVLFHRVLLSPVETISNLSIVYVLTPPNHWIASPLKWGGTR